MCGTCRAHACGTSSAMGVSRSVQETSGARTADSMRSPGPVLRATPIERMMALAIAGSGPPRTDTRGRDEEATSSHAVLRAPQARHEPQQGAKEAMHKIHWFVAILSEVMATTALKAVGVIHEAVSQPDRHSRYGSAFYFLSLCLETISIGAAYAVWSGLGTVLITLIGAVAYKQVLDVAAVVGIGLIVLGVLVLNVFFQDGGPLRDILRSYARTSGNG